VVEIDSIGTLAEQTCKHITKKFHIILLQKVMHCHLRHKGFESYLKCIRTLSAFYLF